MECFAPGSVPCIMTLAQEFALFNFWYSSLPGPTWPNRFFVHASTSGGLSDSPGNGPILSGFSFKNGTIYAALANAGKEWRIYHDGLPQTAGIESLRLSYVDPFTKNFREMQHFADDVQAGHLPEYTFIEPYYGGFLATSYAKGNSMHPQDDVRDVDKLIQLVYEALRNSDYWQDTMLIITFDEHGGLYDHVPPPKAVPTGDDHTYANPNDQFGFDLYGVRVPTIVISAYTQKGTVIGKDRNDPNTMFDHTSILATVQARFGLPPLTARDRTANTLDVALNLDTPRSDAPPKVSPAAPPGVWWVRRYMADNQNLPLTENQRAMLDLAMACDLKASDSTLHPMMMARRQTITSQQAAADYIREVETKIHSRRKVKVIPKNPKPH